MNRLLNNTLNNSWVEITARWILGLTFIYASYHKILAPADFAKILYGYDLFPNALINLIAVILPFVELIFGLALICGIYRRAAAMVVNGLLAAYIIVLSVNLFRGHVFECGCFSVKSSGYLFSPGPMIVRDIIYLAMGMLIFFGGKSKLS